MRVLISYFLILGWLSEYIENYNLDFKDTFLMGIGVTIYSVIILVKDDKILNNMKDNFGKLMINLLTAILVLPSVTCFVLYKYNVVNYENSRSLMLGNTNPIISILLLIGLVLIPILIIYLPKKIINLLNL